MALFLGEALCGGFLGTLLGLVIAGPLAGLLAVPVSQTVSSLYTLVTIEHPTVPWIKFCSPSPVGLGASLLAAWRPAAEAAGCDPAIVLRPGTRSDSFALESRHWAPWGVACLALSTAFSWFALHGEEDFSASLQLVF
jgi:putative ABC transport system permease protein